MVAMALSPEDFSAAVGGAPEFDLLLTRTFLFFLPPARPAHSRWGFIGSIGELSDNQKFRETVAHAQRLGFAGALAIHPTQVAISNEAFAPSAQELEWVRRVVAAENDARCRAEVLRPGRKDGRCTCEIIAMGPKA
ncbi:hypothetical protein [Mesorhizobium sp.]|uniref:hypothetical protein n=1 Tax=Mesorhizobium sp. TaxID=1871066 RepID=UPI0025CEFCFF|nr:hypothetical protein [Mesorhizobium sp.]